MDFHIIIQKQINEEEAIVRKNQQRNTRDEIDCDDAEEEEKEIEFCEIEWIDEGREEGREEWC